MNVHDLKCWPQYFAAVLDGRKPFEVRKSDRAFEVGDALLLREWDPATKDYTGRESRQGVTYILRGGQLGISPDYCVMGIAEDCRK